MKKFLVISLLILWYSADATHYYVSNSGSDAAAGTSTGAPWQHISKVNSSSFSAGDTISFNGGQTFNDVTLRFPSSGSAGNPIVINSYGTGKAIISGFTSISSGSWASVGSNRYTVTVGSLNNMQVVLLDGAYTIYGKYPRGNTGYMNITSHSAVNAGDADTITSTNTTTDNPDSIAHAPDATGGEVVWRAFHWVLWRGTVNSQTSTRCIYTPFAPTSGGSTENPQDTYGFFLQNAPNLCTGFGDYAYNGSTHVLTMNFGAGGPTGHTVLAATTDTVIAVGSHTYITIDGLNIQGGNKYLVSGNGASNIIVKNSVCMGSGIRSIWANGTFTDWTVTNDSILYSNSVGILSQQNTGNKKWTITNNYINQTGNVAGMGGSGEGEYFAIRDITDSSTITGNTVLNSGYVGINFKGKATLVQNNYVDSFCNVKDDGSGIYFGGFDFTGSQVINNICFHGIGIPQGTPDVGDPRAGGIYADDGTSNVEIGNNTSAFNAEFGMYCHDCHEMNFHDNVLYDNGVMGMKYHNGSNLIANVTYKHNISFAKTSAELVYKSVGGSNSPTTFFCAGCLDSNYYCRPIDQSADFLTLVPSVTSYTLSTWKTFIGQDAHSNIEPKTIAATSELKFVYNATGSSAGQGLGAVYEDVTATHYNGSITLASYGSSVLFYLSALASKGTFLFKH